LGAVTRPNLRYPPAPPVSRWTAQNEASSAQNPYGILMIERRLLT
jgi:hypothetical protein